jgi:hypothetical protein
MSQLVWWAIFLVPTLVAMAWAAQRAESGPGDAFDSVAAHNRFVEALSRGERSGDDPD